MPKNSSNRGVQKVFWWQAVCRPATSAKLTNVGAFASKQPLPSASAIDQYFARTEELIVHGKRDLLDGNTEVANLLFVGVISHTENYFRELFARLLQICPASQAKSSGRDIKLGSVIWFRTGLIERGAFEGFSFASAENISDTIKRFFDIALDPKSDSHALLEQYDHLCEIRHAIVHSGGVMSGKNALKLQFPRTAENLHVSIDFSRFQEASSICTALTCSLNRDLFKTFAIRWRDDWPKRVPNWTPTMSNKAFSDLWDIFHSKTDARRNAIPASLPKLKCKAEIVKP